MAALVLGAILGYRKGIVETLIKIVSLVGAYALAVLYFLPLSQYIKTEWQLPWVVSYLLASLLIFFFATMAIKVACRGVLRLLQSLIRPATKAKPDSDARGRSEAASKEKRAEPKQGAKKTGLQSLLGAVVGAGLAGCSALLIIWGLGFLQQGMELKSLRATTPMDKNISELAEQAVVAVGSSVVEAAVEEDSAHRLTKVLLQDPAENLARAQRISTSQALQDLMQDGGAQSVIAAGDTQGLAAHPVFQTLLQDPDLQALYADAGLSEQEPAIFRQEAAEAAMQVFQKVEQLRSNSEAQALLADPDFRKKIEAGNMAALLLDEKFDRFIDLVNSPSETGPSNSASQAKTYTGVQLNDLDKAKAELIGKFKQAADAKQPEPRRATQVYRWTDESGRVHYTDKDPGK